jgi:hypothetical protein
MGQGTEISTATLFAERASANLKIDQALSDTVFQFPVQSCADSGRLRLSHLGYIGISTNAALRQKRHFQNVSF